MSADDCDSLSWNQELERRLAELLAPWSPSITKLSNGTLSLILGDCSEVNKACELVPCGDYLGSLTFYDCDASDRGLTRVLQGEHHSLTDLSIRRTNVTGAAFDCLRRCPRLTEVAYDGQTGIGNMCSSLGRYCSELEFVNLENSAAVDSSLPSIGIQRSLRDLRLSNTHIRGDGLSAKQFPALRRLVCVTGLCTDALAREASILEYLSELDIGGIAVTDGSARMLSSHRTLSSLSLYCTSISDEGLRQLCRMPSLRTLVLSQATEVGDGLSCMANCETLNTLELCEVNVTKDVISALASSPSIVEFVLERVRGLSEGVISALCRWKSLKSLSIDKCGLSMRDIARLEASLGDTWVSASTD